MTKPQIAALAIRQEIQVQARRELWKFAVYVDPQQKRWYRAPHLRKIAEYLEAVERGEIDRLIINVPPRHWKSSISSIKFPAWYLGKNPTHPIIVASYAKSLAEKYSRAVRDTIAGERFASLFPDVKVRRDSGRMDDWLLEQGYHTSFRAVGTGGGIAGHGAKLAILDDVSDPNKQSSPTETLNDWEWYKNVIRTRLEPDGAIVIVNNRVGVDDITGYLLDKERNDSADPPHVWTVVSMPALDETTGAYLWSDRFTDAFYQSLQNDPRLWRIQYQQKPEVEEGDLIKREWFGHKRSDGVWDYDVIEGLGGGMRWQVQPIDFAITEKQTLKHDPDWTATCKMAFHNGIVYVGEPRLWRAEIDESIRRIVALKVESPYVRLGMGRLGIRSQVVRALNNAAFNIEEYPEIKDKVVSSSGWRNVAATGRVKLVGTAKEWEQFFLQWFSFPGGAHDDAVDVVSLGYEMLGYPLAAPTPGLVKKKRHPGLMAAWREARWGKR